jgi:tellurite resistance protein TehA-like permease
LRGNIQDYAQTMSTTVKQALVLAFGGLLIISGIGLLARRRLLTTRYALGWVGVGAAVTVAAVTMPFIGQVGELANMTPTAVLLAISTIILLSISVQLSISVSMLQERLRTTAEAQALLAQQVAELRDGRS